MTQPDRIFETIKRIVKLQLAPARVIEVLVKEDIDFEGEEILRVEVTFEVEGDRLDPEKVVGLARHLREPLEELHEDRFPVFTFMKPGELDGAAA